MIINIQSKQLLQKAILKYRQDNETTTAVTLQGAVRGLSSIPYDYKEKNPGMFRAVGAAGAQTSPELYSQDGSGETTTNQFMCDSKQFLPRASRPSAFVD